MRGGGKTGGVEVSSEGSETRWRITALAAGLLVLAAIVLLQKCTGQTGRKRTQSIGGRDGAKGKERQRRSGEQRELVSKCRQPLWRRFRRISP